MPHNPVKSLAGATVLLLLHLSCLQSVSASHTSSHTCVNNTVWDVVKSDPDLSIYAKGAEAANADIFLGAPEVNTTVFLPTNLAAVRGVYDYAAVTDINTDYFGSGLTINLVAYSTLDGILSPQNLTSYPSLNTVMGMLEIADFVIRFTNSTTTPDEYYVTGLAPNNTAKVLSITRACNGYVNKLDQVLKPSELASIVPSQFKFGAQMVEIFFGNCPIPLDMSVAQTIPDSQSWMVVWNDTQMVVPLSNHLLGSTIFVPQNKGVDAAGEAANSADAVMFNMIDGDWCPEELAGYGTKNSVLGQVRGRQDATLKFSKDSETGQLLITGPRNTARVLNVTNLCHNIIYTTDVPLLPPLSAGAGSSSAAPEELPLAIQRHVFCIPPKSNPNALEKPDPSKNPAIELEQEIRDGQVLDGTGTITSSSGNNDAALAIGLGVGLGCAAVLLGAGLGFVLVKRRRGSNNNGNNTTNNSDKGTDTKLLPSQSSDMGTGGTTTSSPTFALVSDIFSGDAPSPVTTATSTEYNNNSALNSAPKSGGGSSVAGGMSTGGSSKSQQELARLGSVSAGLPEQNSEQADGWDVKPSDLQIALDSAGKPIELGKGTYGVVYRGIIRQVQPAAIKVLHANLGVEATAAFWREAAILKHASRDRNIVQLYGTSKLPDGRFLLVTELMEQGDLRDALSNEEKKFTLLWPHCGKSIAIDIARGVTALHAMNVIHRDLKSKNVLLTENLTAKVADVGIAAVHAHGYLTASAGQVFGTLAWSAPELLMGERISDKVDIYSLGVLLWEIATNGKVPQRGYIDPPPPSEYCPAELSALIEECIDPDPADRPTATQVYERLLQIPK